MKRSQRQGGGTRKNYSGKSRYAEKRERNDMMYGPGCCAHGVSGAQITAARQKAREEGRVHESFGDRRQETM